jgi:hypothetical protein
MNDTFFNKAPIRTNLMRTGCFVKMCPLKKFFKFLTIFLISLFVLENISFAQALMDQEKASTYLRWNFFTGRDQLQFNKKANIVVIKTLNSDLYKNLKDELSSLKIDQSYIKGINYKESDAANAMAIEIELKNDNVEMFSFYRERDKKFVVDFWMDGDTVTLNKAAIKKPIEEGQQVEEVSAKTAKPLPITPAITKALKLKTKKGLAPKSAPKEDLASIIKEDKILSSFVVDPNKILVKSEKELLAEEVESKNLIEIFAMERLLYGTMILLLLPIKKLLI